MTKVSLNTYFQTALSLYQSGKFSEARKLWRDILKLHPKHFESLLMVGRSFLEENRFEEALKTFSEGLVINPDGLNFFISMAQTYVKLNQFDSAEKILVEGIEKTGSIELKVNLAIVRSHGNRHKDAVHMFSALEIDKIKSPKVFFYYAKSLSEVGKIEECISNYTKCLQLNPTHKGALNNLANVHHRNGKYRMAIRHYKELVKHYPNEPMGFNNLAVVYEKLGEYEKSILYYRKAIARDASFTMGYYNLSHLYAAKLNNHEQALDVCNEGLINGGGRYVSALRFQQIISRQFLADWSDYEKDSLDLNRIVKQYIERQDLGFEIVPFSLSFSKLEDSLYRKVAETYAFQLDEKTKHQFPEIQYDHTLSNKKIKIGYYSSEFWHHPGGFLVRTLFNYHDASSFEVHAFSLVRKNDSINKDIQESVDYYHDVSSLSSLEIANLINRAGIDILVALAGHNAFMNMEVLSLKPAPIQMMVIGSQETTGASFIDYVFSDQYMMDETLRTHFSENLITLPSSLLFNCALPAIKTSDSERGDHGLPKDAFVFASFNHPKKIDPEVMESWCEILHQTPDSVLWLYGGGADRTKKNIQAYIEKQSISLERLIFAQPIETEQHWERHKHVDLFLDCFVCNGHFTALETLRLGKLILTMKGNNHNSRLCSSLLHYAGLDSLITFSKKEYVETAIKLAGDREELHRMETKLRSHDSIPLFDSEMQIRFLEKAYKMALLNYKKTGQSKDLIVKSSLKFDSFS